MNRTLIVAAGLMLAIAPAAHAAHAKAAKMPAPVTRAYAKPEAPIATAAF